MVWPITSAESYVGKIGESMKRGVARISKGLLHFPIFLTVGPNFAPPRGTGDFQVVKSRVELLDKKDQFLLTKRR